jgi:hypothetical protein
MDEAQSQSQAIRLRMEQARETLKEAEALHIKTYGAVLSTGHITRCSMQF